MKESIATIPLMDAFKEDDECPFCYLQRMAEQHAINFILGSGSAYMEDDIRMKTDEVGFCRHHFKMMYDYGNRLGTALILGTHLKKINGELAKALDGYKPGKSSFLKSMKKVQTDGAAKTAIGGWVDEKTTSCYVCDHEKMNYDRYLETFFYLYKKDPAFMELFKKSKGFCLPHFRDVVEAAEDKLADKQKEEFYGILFPKMKENFARIEEEVDYFIGKYDYQNKDADWKNSRDSIQRAIQKLSGGYPADPIFTQDL